MVHSTCWLIDMYITQVMYYVLMSSSILGLLFYWVKIRLHTENQLPRLPGSALKVPVELQQLIWVELQQLIWFLPIIKSSSNSS